MIRLMPLTLLACAACTSNTAGPATSGDASGTQCNADKVQSFVGKPGDVATVERIKSGSGARDVRRYATGSALTMDFRPDRVNVEVGTDGNVVKIGCG